MSPARPAPAGPAPPQEIELDIDALATPTLWKLYECVFATTKSKQKKAMSQGEKLAKLDLTHQDIMLRLQARPSDEAMRSDTVR